MERGGSSYFAPHGHGGLPARVPSGTTPLDEAPPTPSTEHPPPVRQPPATAARNVHFHSLDRQQSAIRLRRLKTRPPSLSSVKESPAAAAQNPGRASSQRAGLSHDDPLPVVVQPLAPVPENGSQQGSGPQEVAVVAGDPRREGFHRLLGRRRHPAPAKPAQGEGEDDCYDSRIVDILDVIDPEVATLSSITNVQNSLYIPYLGRWVNRQPTYDLSHLPQIPGAFPESVEDLAKQEHSDADDARTKPDRGPSLSSILSEAQTQYAILPDDATLHGWTDDEVKLLNDYVRHMLHSRRSKFKQRIKAFGKYARRPIGFLVTLYATLITLFGLAWVLFLIGWIYVGEKQLYVINVIDYVLVALFAVVGDGLIPWRIQDTYRMAFIAHYHRKTWKL